MVYFCDHAAIKVPDFAEPSIRFVGNDCHWLKEIVQRYNEAGDVNVL